MSNRQNVIHSFNWLNSTEWNVAIFSFLLSFFWEVRQMPFYQVSVELSCFGMSRNCTLATVGDVGISLTSFWTVARQWIHNLAATRWVSLSLWELSLQLFLKLWLLGRLVYGHMRSLCQHFYFWALDYCRYWCGCWYRSSRFGSSSTNFLLLDTEAQAMLTDNYFIELCLDASNRRSSCLSVNIFYKKV